MSGLRGLKGALESVCEFEEPYRTPPGYYDVPYIYAKSYFLPNTSPLITPGGVPPIALLNTLNDAIPSDNDSDFILRKVGTTIAATAGFAFNFLDALSYRYFTPVPLGNNPIGANRIGFDPFAIVPEKLFPAGSAIQYVIPGGAQINELLEFGGITPFIAYFQVIFQGVKRFAGIPDRRPNYTYSERCWTYVFPFNLNWFFLIAPFASYTADNVRTFYIPVKDYDFELMQIGIDFPGTSLFGFQVRLFDANTRALSNDYIDAASAISAVGTQSGGAPPAAQQSQPNCFPVPSIIYPIGSVIRIDVRSLASSNVGQGNTGGGVTLFLKGVQRIPC